MKRKEWIFKASGEILLTGAITKREHHRERAEWWKDEYDIAINNIEQDGIAVTESMVLNHGTLMEYREQIKFHQSKEKEYAGWISVLVKNQNDEYDLNQDDWLYFFGD